MHGIVFAELRRYVDARLGPGAWQQLVEASGLAHRVYLVAQQFPDEEFGTLLAAAAARAGRPEAEVLEDFGEAVAPELLKMHAHSILPEWRTLDLIEHTEDAIHRIVRASDIDAHPPEIVCRRLRDDELEVEYGSARRLCRFARGIMRGIASHYGDRLALAETSCMQRGADRCRFRLKVG